MATVINNPGSSEGGSGAGMWIGIVVVILLLAAFFVYGLPAIRGNGGASNGGVNITLPANTSGGGASGGTSGGASGGSGY